MNNKNFYKDLDLRYPEIAICIEDTNTKIGKFFIPILTPTVSKSHAWCERNNTFSRKNIINKDDLIIEPVYESNYIELKLPNGFKKKKKDDKFIVIFIGGNINKPVLIGGYDE